MDNYEENRERQRKDSLKIILMVAVGILIYVTSKFLATLILL